SLYLVVHYRQSHLFLNLKRNLKQIKNRKNHGKSLVTQSKSTHSTSGNISTFSSKINMINFEVKIKSTLKTIFNKERPLKKSKKTRFQNYVGILSFFSYN